MQSVEISLEFSLRTANYDSPLVQRRWSRTPSDCRVSQLTVAIDAKQHFSILTHMHRDCTSVKFQVHKELQRASVARVSIVVKPNQLRL